MLPDATQNTLFPMWDACQADRRNVARYLHDTVSQDLIVLSLLLTLALRDSAGKSEPGVSRALEVVSQCSNNLRSLIAVLSPLDPTSGSSLSTYLEHLGRETRLQIRFIDERSAFGSEQLQSENDSLTPGTAAGMPVFAAIQPWAAYAIGRRPAGIMEIRLREEHGALRLDFLSTLFADPALEALRESPLFGGNGLFSGSRTETVPGHTGSSVRLFFEARKGAVACAY